MAALQGKARSLKRITTAKSEKENGASGTTTAIGELTAKPGNRKSSARLRRVKSGSPRLFETNHIFKNGIRK